MTDALTEKPPTAVLLRRYLAHLLDFAFHAATVAVPFWLLANRPTDGAVRPSGEPFADTFPQGADRAIRIDDRLFLFDRNELILIAAISFAVTLLFFVIIQGRLGWTVGKLLTGLRTVDGSGERPGVVRAFLRTLLLPIDALPSTPFLPLVGGLVALFTDNRRIGDLVAGTYVVRRSAVGQDPTGGGNDLDTTGWEPVGDGPAPVTTLAAGEALRVGEAAEPDPTETFTAPAATPTAEDAEGAEAKAPAYQPQWDPARQAYLQWHPGKQQWLQFDEPSGEWRPIG